MRVSAVPEALEWQNPDLRTYDHKKEEARVNAHAEKVREWLRENGYQGNLTGLILRVPFADGSAYYMFADGGRRAVLIHLPYYGGYHNPDVQYLPKRVVVSRLRPLFSTGA